MFTLSYNLTHYLTKTDSQILIQEST